MGELNLGFEGFRFELNVCEVVILVLLVLFVVCFGLYLECVLLYFRVFVMELLVVGVIL